MSDPGPAGGRPDRSDRMADLVEEWELREAIGGVRGIVDSGLASTVFLLVYVLDGKKLGPALAGALVTTVVVLVVRLARHEPVRQALGGVLVVGISAAIAIGTGRAANFYVFGIAVQICYALAYLVSLAVGWPLLGVLVGPLIGEGFRWHSDPPRRRAYWWASWIWFCVFAIRVAIQVPLYLHDHVVSLGVSTLLLGWPMFAVAAVLSWLVLRRVPLSLAPESVDPDEPVAAQPLEAETES
ncbi:MAG: DUF3159 domain-containing protein [Actinomycetes bacterium]